MPEAAAKTTKKQTNPLVYIGIGCVVLLFLGGVGSTIFFRFFAKKAIEGVIENRTGVKTNLTDVENGKMTFTDTKTGSTVNVGGGTVPDTFPKDFPLYPGAKVTSSLSGAQAGKNNGFWTTMSTPDSVDKVTAFYKAQLASKGWTIEATYTASGTTTETMTKTGWSGSLAISSDTSTKETQIVIILGQDDATPTPIATDTPAASNNSGY